MEQGVQKQTNNLESQFISSKLDPVKTKANGLKETLVSFIRRIRIKRNQIEHFPHAGARPQAIALLSFISIEIGNEVGEFLNVGFDLWNRELNDLSLYHIMQQHSNDFFPSRGLQ